MSRRVLRTIRPWHTVALALAFAGACSEELQGGPDASLVPDAAQEEEASDAGADDAASGIRDAEQSRTCPWGVDAVLMKVGQQAFKGRNCGSYSYSNIEPAFACFEKARTRGEAALLTVNKCVDCSNEFTYVANGQGELFEIQFENDAFGGDSISESVLSRCDAVTFDGSGFAGTPETNPLSAGGDVKCVGRSELYRCSDPTTARNSPRYPAMEPLKISDVLAVAGQPSTTLHLYISNQSFDDPLVNIRLQIDNWDVVQGDFAVEGQHNWIEFDIQVPTGTRRIMALTFKPDHAVSLSQSIEVPGERWVVVDYWHSKDEEERFTLNVSDTQVAFQ